MSTPLSFTSPCKGEVGREADGRGSPFQRTRSMTQRARRLRAQLSDAEQKLWRALRREQINGLSFRRQHPVGAYALDFYCPALHLAIEVDGGQHAEATIVKKDRKRSEYLAEHGIHIVRFWNNDVLGNLNGVLEEIVRLAHERKMTPSPTLPLSGGGRSGSRT